ncbi:uncharacterized protein [Clytia hemisphaerica]|uniref:Uncharacterized protein n=1 Tax=Clytia hemisphaerica TaxID=252671 RepID=A0A7M5XKS0_9CNID
MASVAVRIINSDNKVAMDWTFISLEFFSLTYEDLISKITSEQFPQCVVKDSVFSCKILKTLYGLASSSSKEFEKIRGRADTDIIQIENRFSMIYFTVCCQHVEGCEDCLILETPLKPPEKPTVFSFLMNTARAASNSLTLEIENPGTKKEKLFNEVLKMLKERSCRFPNKHFDVLKSFLNKLTDALWYIDGHKATIERESIRKIPEFFKTFEGYNKPELSKHRKRTIDNLSSKRLLQLSHSLKDAMHCMKFIDDSRDWSAAKLDILILAETLQSYASYLDTKNVAVKRIHLTPRSEVEKQSNVTVLPICRKENLYYKLVKADIELEKVDVYEPITLRENLQAGMSRKRFFYILDGQLLQKGLTSKAVHYAHNLGGPKPALHFLWKIPNKFSDTELLKKNLEVITDIRKNIPIYERRITKREFKNSFGFAAPSHVLRSIFKNLKNDQSLSNNMNETEIDRRLDFSLMAGDEGILVDLREQNSGPKDKRFETFFKETEKYLKEEVGVTVHERRHTQQLYVAKAVSFRDLRDRVKERVPANTPIPSVKWLRYQFQPINPTTNTAKYYKGRLKIKMMVQKRQVRVHHVDAHYCAASWRYMREYAIKHRDIVHLVSLDDKHKIKCGEPSYPVAAVERGKKVIVGEEQVMPVGDHDFTKFGIIPSVSLVIDIPDDIDGSFYRGQVHIGFKDSVLQASSALRHSAELKNVLAANHPDKPVLLMYSDGGPDHRLTYNSVKLALISLFIELDLDLLIALRTAPSNSWANPVERIMSIINIGLQGIGVMRTKVGDEFEKAVGKAKTLKEIREVVAAGNFNDELTRTLQDPMVLLQNQMKRLNLKTNAFKTFSPAASDEIDKLWANCLQVDDGINRDDTTKKGMKENAAYHQFIKKHCKATHYAFQIKKCQDGDCGICKPYRDQKCIGLPFLPDPELKPGEEHYKPLSEMYGKVTTDNRPSLKARPPNKRKKIGFSPSQQHAKNTDMMMQCDECNKWRLIFSKKKLTKKHKDSLNEILANIAYTCGFMFDDVNLPNGITVFVKDHDCADPIERLYYSCGYEPICIQCGWYLRDADEDDVAYPQCVDCTEEPIKKR